MRQKILIVINSGRYFLTNRKEVPQALLAAGYDVHIALPLDEYADEIRSLGFTLHHIDVSRRGMNLWSDGKLFFQLCRLYQTLQPDLVHHITIKPVLWGAIAARFVRVPACLNILPGLGYLFLPGSRLKSLLRTVVCWFFETGLSNPHSLTVFQSVVNQDLFIKRRIIKPERARLISSSGVDLQTHAVLTLPCGPITFMLPARMLTAKGVREFVEAARACRHLSARFLLAGDTDSGNPHAIPRSQLQAWHDEGVIEWLGWVKNMNPVYEQSHVVCLPSYSEGTPKCLLEAGAHGRAIITTDTPGCREVVLPNVSGLLVKPRDVDTLIEAFTWFVEHADKIEAMGLAGRALIAREYALTKIISQTMTLYNELLVTQGAGNGLTE